MEKTVLQCVLEFKKRYPNTIMWRVKKHCDVVQKHLNPGEKVIYAFAAQCNDVAYNIFDTAGLCVTSDRILIGQDQILYGYTLNSITPEMYNDLQVFSGIFWGKITIDTVKEVITFSNFMKKALPEIDVVFKMDIGHTYPHMYVVNGAMAKVDICGGHGSIQYEMKE